MNSGARTYAKSRLKAHMLEIMRELEWTGKEAIVADHGRPVLRIVPIRKGRTVSEVFQLRSGFPPRWWAQAANGSLTCLQCAEKG